MDITSLAPSLINLITPFLPVLLETVKQSGGRALAKLAKQGEKFALEQAQKLWEIIRSHDDGDIEDAARMVARKPDDKQRTNMLELILADKLKNDPAFSRKILQAMEGANSSQVVRASGRSRIQDVAQKTSKGGKQSVIAEKGSVIKKVKQTSGR